MATLHSILAARRPTLGAAVAEDELAALARAAKQAWPGVALDDAIFVAHLADRLPDGADPERALAAVHAGDLYLACACSRRDPEAIAAFERTHLSRVDAAVAKVDGARDFVDEVRQRLRERLLVGARPRIADYTGSGSLAGWVRVAAVRLALNTRREARRSAQLRPPSSVAGDPERELIHRRYRGEVEAAFRAAFAGLDEPARELLRLHYVDGISLEEIARRRQVDRSTASRRVAAVRQRLLDQTHHELERRVPAITRASRDSLLLLLRSQLDFSLDSILRR
jgi:RNA polymerase sigma-70 factor (ECF subfamily)